MNKKRAIQIMTECARQYESNLCGKSLLFVYGNPENPSVLPAVFYESHFRHLTGVITRMSAKQFYLACLSSKLSEKDFEFKPNGTTEQKLTVMPFLLSIHRNGRTIANYNGSSAILNTEKVVGNHSATMGLVSDHGYYIPNTILQGDVRIFGELPFYNLLAVLRRGISECGAYELFGLMRGTDEEQLRERLLKIGIQIL